MPHHAANWTDKVHSRPESTQMLLAGRVPRHRKRDSDVGRSFEKVLSPSTMKVGIAHGIGCYPDKLPQEEQTKSIVPDQFQHELATAYNLKGRGLVILTACSHRGVVNTIKQAQAASGVTKVHAVIGGFHLAPYNEDYVRQTIAALNEMDVDYVIPLHCSGEVFYELAKAEMPTKLAALRICAGKCPPCVAAIPWEPELSKPEGASPASSTCPFHPRRPIWTT
jgi:metal-dependent hydrolase (beta-lactamase superfamily II)